MYENCGICLEPMSEEDKIVEAVGLTSFFNCKKNVNHFYHTGCLDEWKNTKLIGKRTCPECRCILKDQLTINEKIERSKINSNIKFLFFFYIQFIIEIYLKCINFLITIQVCLRTCQTNQELKLFFRYVIVGYIYGVFLRNTYYIITG